MRRLKSWFKVAQHKPENCRKESLFRTIPFTYIIFLTSGICLSNVSKIAQFTTYLVFLVLRVLFACAMLKFEFELDVSMVAISHVMNFFLAFIAYGLLIRKRQAIIDFVMSDVTARTGLKRIDLLFSLAHFGSIVFMIISLFVIPEEYSVFDFMDCCPRLSAVLMYIFLAVNLVLFQITTPCAFIHALGYCVLYTEKFNVLNSISREIQEQSLDYNCTLKRLKSVSAKQDQFEFIFGPFLFLSLLIFFILTVFLIYYVQVSLLYRTFDFLFITVYSFFIQMACMGHIFFVSICNDRLRTKAADVSSQLEENLTAYPTRTLWLIGHLQKKIDETINQPLTAWKMMIVDRKIVLSTAASCVSFSVLYIQISNGSLNSSIIE